MVDTGKKRSGASPCETGLARIEEFCECFSAARIQHDVSFEVSGGWQAARELVDAANESGLNLVSAGFQNDKGICHLSLRMMSSPGAVIAALWEQIATVPEAVLTKWDTTARFERNG